MNYEDLIKSLEEYRLRHEEKFSDWIQKYADSDYDASAWSWEHDAYTMAIEAAKIAYKEGSRNPKWNDSECSQIKFKTLAYDEGIEAASKDHKAWCVEDKNSEKIYIGDNVYAENMNVNGIVIGFTHEACTSYCVLRIPNIGVTPRYCEARRCKKITPDTREKIIEDLADWGLSLDDEDARKVAEQFVSRVEALGASHE